MDPRQRINTHIYTTGLVEREGRNLTPTEFFHTKVNIIF
jgi:hypothetical protein